MADTPKGTEHRLTKIEQMLAGMQDTLKRIDERTDGQSESLASQGTVLAVLKSQSDVRLPQHDEMYGFYNTFKNFLWPLIFSGPISAIISAFITYLLVHGRGSVP